MTFRLALVGRPNVGKSTLYNRLARRGKALVDDRPHLTRDWQEAVFHLGDVDGLVIDTPGLESNPDNAIVARAIALAETKLHDASVIAMVVDATTGCTSEDRRFAAYLHRFNKPLILIANKCENDQHALLAHDFFQLGLGEPICLSAAHGHGLSSLEEALLPHYTPSRDATPDREKPLRIAIVGRPNSGKSTFFNAVLGQERVLTGDEAGLTRDSIVMPWLFKGQAIELIDTAGLRRRSKVDDKAERLATFETRHALELSPIVILMIDALRGLEKQDLTLARQVIEEGRVLMVAVNKMDAVANSKRILADLRSRLDDSLAQIKSISLHPISALKNDGFTPLFNAALKNYARWNTHIPTARLNKWLEATQSQHPAPLVKGRRLKIKYMTQAKTRPPTFTVFISQAIDLPEDYARYLVNQLRQDFKLQDIPLRLITRQPKNPYAHKKSP